MTETRPTTSVPCDGYGDLIVVRDECWRTSILQADPRVRLDADMVRCIMLENPPWARYDWDTATGARTITFLDDRTGRRVIYRLGQLDPVTGTFHAEWPD